MPDDHSDVVPLLPIPNRTVKRVSADDSAGSRVKVGHRQANYSRKAQLERVGLFFGQKLSELKSFVKQLRKCDRCFIGWILEHILQPGRFSGLNRRKEPIDLAFAARQGRKDGESTFQKLLQ